MSVFSTPQEIVGIARRKRKDRLFVVVMGVAAGFAVIILATLLIQIGINGSRFLSQTLLTGYPSIFPKNAGILPALLGSLYLMITTAVITVPLGVGAAIYLEEFNTRKNWFTETVKVNIANLSGVPSIVYGMLGLSLFIPFVGWLAGDAQKGKVLLTGALTMSLLILPLVILVSQEALRAVPRSLRDGSLALGANQWQTIRRVVLPQAFSGILTGIILALSRAIGETAPLIVVGVASVSFLPDGLLSNYNVLPLQIYDWVSRPQPEWKDVAASTIVVLMVMLLILNSAAIYLRARSAKRRIS